MVLTVLEISCPMHRHIEWFVRYNIGIVLVTKGYPYCIAIRTIIYVVTGQACSY